MANVEELTQIEFNRYKLLDSTGDLREGLQVGYCPYCNKLDLIFNCENERYHTSKVCINCSIVIDDANFCPDCTKICTKCGKSTVLIDDLCYKCGK